MPFGFWLLDAYNCCLYFFFVRLFQTRFSFDWFIIKLSILPARQNLIHSFSSLLL
uniref:Uncharacterized protein n=1 Tax=Rhizophora mucronata TaxID=61149 RepID=A0A2P2QFB4_RHIMU